MNIQTMRERFERDITGDGKFRNAILTNGKGAYILAATSAAWNAWQAAIASEPDLGQDDEAAIWAFRYCLGRMSTAPSSCADWLVRVWPRLHDHAKAIIRRDLEEAFKADDDDRANGHECKRLGWDCDRQSWERVRALP